MTHAREAARIADGCRPNRYNAEAVDWYEELEGRTNAELQRDGHMVRALLWVASQAICGLYEAKYGTPGPYDSLPATWAIDLITAGFDVRRIESHEFTHLKVVWVISWEHHRSRTAAE